MALARYSSRIFAAWRAVKVLLDGVTWTAHPVGSGRPVVSLADVIPDRQREVVAIVPTTEDDAIEWVQMGAASREERFGLDILFRTEVPGVEGYDLSSGADVLTRLETISNQIQSLFYNTTTGAFTPPDFPGVQQLGGIGALEPAIWPADEGWFGSVNHRLLIASRI